MFNPLDPAAAPTPRARRLDTPEWRAVLAALRPVSAAVAAIADAELRRPSYRPGLSLDDAAFVEGRKELWRDILAALQEG
jgi:hypothetical protein